MTDIYIYDDALMPITSSLIQIVENDSIGVKVDVQASVARTGGYGATLLPPTPLVPVGIWIDDTGGTYASSAYEFLNPSASLRLDVTLFPLPASARSSGSSGGAGSGGSSSGGGGRAAGGIHGAPGSPGPTPDDDETDEMLAQSDLVIGRGGDWRFAPDEDSRTPEAFAWFTDMDLAAFKFGWTPEQTRGVRTLIATVAKARLLPNPDEEFRARIRRWEAQLYALRTDDRRGRGPGRHGMPPKTRGGLEGFDVDIDVNAIDHPRRRVPKQLPDMEIG